MRILLFFILNSIAFGVAFVLLDSKSNTTAPVLLAVLTYLIANNPIQKIFGLGKDGKIQSEKDLQREHYSNLFFQSLPMFKMKHATNNQKRLIMKIVWTLLGLGVVLALVFVNSGQDYEFEVKTSTRDGINLLFIIAVALSAVSFAIS